MTETINTTNPSQTTQRRPVRTTASARSLTRTRPSETVRGRINPALTPPINWIDPAGFPDQYGMRVCGDCMLPEFGDGDLLCFDRTLPVKAGDLVIIFRRPELVRPKEHQAQVKRLVFNILPNMTFPYQQHPDSGCVPCIVAEMLNPHRQFIIQCTDVLAVHRCLGKLPEERASGLFPAPRLRRTQR